MNAHSGASKGVEIIIPFAGRFLTVDCGKCGGTDYKLKVLPVGDTTAPQAKLYKVECVKCKNVLNIDENRIIEGKEKSSFSSIIKPVGVR